jgi:putative thioredoxin
MDSTLSDLNASKKPAGDLDDLAKDVSLATFMADVIDASRQGLVIVDFWAPWCGPCKQLGPLLEKVVRSYKGAVRLAKVDIDKNPEIAQQMRVQSIPAVFAFFQGQPVDGFMGALPETQIKAWVDRLMKAVGKQLPEGEGGYDTALKQAAEFLANGDTDKAESIYADILTEDPANTAAYAGVLRCFLTRGETDKAREGLEKAPPAMSKDKVFDSIRTALELADQAAMASGSLGDLKGKVAENPADCQARFDLALAYYAASEREAAVDELLEIVRRDRKWNDEAARKQLVKLFESFGPTDPLTIAARKRLSSILFS